MLETQLGVSSGEELVDIEKNYIFAVKSITSKISSNSLSLYVILYTVHTTSHIRPKSGKSPLFRINMPPFNNFLCSLQNPFFSIVSSFSN